MSRFYKFPRSEELRQELKLTQTELASRANISRSTLRRVESGLPVTASVAMSVFQVLAVRFPELARDYELNSEFELIPCEPQDRSEVDTRAIIVKYLVDWEDSHSVLNRISVPLRLGVSLGQATSLDLADFFHELSVLHTMVGGSGLSFHFEDTRELEKVSA